MTEKSISATRSVALLKLVAELKTKHNLPDKSLKALFTTSALDQELFTAADELRQKYYGREVYIRGLIEFTNYCRNNCYYCGIRAGNKQLKRYRLSEDTILACCREGYSLGFRTFVLQGGEDPYYTDAIICRLVFAIKDAFPDCAVTLSLGEKKPASYKAYFTAGASRYLLREETARTSHYARLHPPELSLLQRKACLYALKDIGYQVGAGFMVGSPYQIEADLLADLRFLQELQPAMIGIGPFIAQGQTPFAHFASGSLALTLRLIAILRLMFPYALIPATTALGTINPVGRELGLRAGANVVMPNLSPGRVRKFYALYDAKICTGEEAAQCRGCLKRRVKGAGYQIVTDIGDVKRKLS